MRGIIVLALLACWLPIGAVAQEAAARDPAAVEAADDAMDAAARPPEAATLEELLELVREGGERERAENRAREERFRAERDDRAELLERTKADLARAQALSESLESEFQENELALAEREETLTERLGNLGELFGVVRQVAGDTRSHLHDSLTSAQIQEDRDAFLADLGRKRKLPRIESLERLWFELQREMTEQGRVVEFRTPVLSIEGGEEQKEVVRAGVFSALADGRYLLWDPDVQRLQELKRQPPAEFVSTVAAFEASDQNLAPLAIDPSRGSLLAVLIDTRSLPERVPDGGLVGYAIIALGSLAAILAVVRMLVIWNTARRVEAQQGSDEADPRNPLGRVLGVFEANREADVETLELKLDEAVMSESSRLNRFVGLVRVVSVVAPLMGLLGTVTGMIRTFQAITLFGAGDPRMMAGGISEALVTTMLGLTVAIPLVLLHAALAGNVNRIQEVLQEQSTGLVARRAEQAQRA